MTTTQALEEALEFIQFGWTQNASARDGGGHAVAPDYEFACAFSLYGALTRATWPERPFDHDSADRNWQAGEDAAYVLAKRAGMNGDPNAWAYVAKWNDARGRTKEQVVELLREALNERAD